MAESYTYVVFVVAIITIGRVWFKGIESIAAYLGLVSAGIAIATSIISTITETPIDKNVAMTGEITLTGNVLAIGGLKEKLLAAHRAGIKKVLIPENNKKDLVEIPKNILKDIEVTTVKNLDEVLKVALTKELKSVEWIDVDSLSKQKEGTVPEISTN